MSASLTGYGQALRIAIQDIYGIDAISGATLPKVNRKIEAANRPGLYEDILIRRSNIAYSVLDDYWNAAPVRPGPKFFVCARKFDRFVAPQSVSDVCKLEELTDVSITGLAGLRRAMETSFEQSLNIGMITVKSTLASTARSTTRRSRNGTQRPACSRCSVRTAVRSLAAGLVWSVRSIRWTITCSTTSSAWRRRTGCRSRSTPACMRGTATSSRTPSRPT